MKRLKTLPFAILTTALTASLGTAATVTISLVRVDLADAVWNQYTSSLENYEAVVDPDGDYIYAVQTDADSIDFIFDFPAGWDYALYETWKFHTMPMLNQNLEAANAGIRWEVRAEGEISDDSNPWQGVNWLPDAVVVNGDHLVAPELGWFYADNWDPEGGFWAYPYNLVLGWLYVFGGGYFYDAEAEAWLYNLAGTRWFYDFSAGEWTAVPAQ